MSETKEPQTEKKELSKKLSFNSELIFFKNELLGDLKQIEFKFAKKLGDQKDDTQNQLLELHNKIDALTKKIFNISNTISQNKFDEEKIESLHKFRSKMEETINLQELRMNSIAMDLVNAINKYDRLIDKNLFYPGIIGADNARFTTLHNFIDYVLKNIEQLNTFKEQTIGFDFERYKKKLTSMMEGIRKQSDQILTHGRLFTIQYMENLEKKVKSDFELYDQKLFDIKIKTAEQYSDFDKIIKEYEKTATITNLQMKEFLKQYNDMNKKFDLIIEFLKGVKSGQGNHMNFNEFVSYKNSQEFYKKKPNVESYLKKYIGGLLGMDELSKLSRKHRYGEENTNNNTNNNANNNSNVNKKFIRKKTTNLATPSKPISNNLIFLNNNAVNPKASLSKSISQGLLAANKMNNNLKDNLKNKYMNNSNEKIVKDEKIKLSSSIKRNNLININKKNVENAGNVKEKSFKEKSQENILDEITETITGNNSINEEDNKNKNENIKIENNKIENNKIENSKIENSKMDSKEKEKEIKVKNTPKKKETEQKNSKEKRSPSNKSYKEDDKKDKLMNNIKVEKKFNDNVDEQKNNNINKIPDVKKDNNNINNNYNFNIILEHNENEEKEYDVESDLDAQIKLNNQKIANLMEKENNTNIIDFENNSNNLDMLKNELLFELQDKRMPNTNKNNKTYTEKFYINDNNKNNLHKLLTGDKNALRYFKIINNGQEIDLSNMTIKDKNKNNYGNFNLNNRNMQYFDNVVQNKNIDDSNFYNTINSGFYINGGKNRNNSNFKTKKMDITRSVSTNYKANRNKPKLKIVNLPEIPNSVNKETDYQRTDDYFYEQDSQRNVIGKFNNNYDLYGKGVGPFKTNIRNMSPNNIKLRAYDGFT